VVESSAAFGAALLFFCVCLAGRRLRLLRESIRAGYGQEAKSQAQAKHLP